jgi:hypothetical protein
METMSFGGRPMRYAGLFFALGLLVATVAPAYADCPAHEQTATASQAKLKQSKADPQG